MATPENETPENETPLKGTKRIPVYVMLPLHILDGPTNKVNYGRRPSPAVGLDERYDKLKTLPEKVLLADLDSLKKAKVQGVMVDCWWGIVEAEGPGQYNWDGYKNLFSIVKAADLELHVVMSFHACVENGVETIPLPGWVKRIGEEKDLFYKDAHDNPSTEYLSWAVDKKPVLKDQFGHRLSPLQVYKNFMIGFNTHMVDYFNKQDEKGIITMIEVGLGPCGELRYPAYRLPWTFNPTPGVGEFQCYDKYMMESWKNEAEERGFTIPCCVGPQTAGGYESTPDQTQFFQDQTVPLTNGICYWDEYGKTFLTWYSKNLVDHGEIILQAAKEIFMSNGVNIAAKVPGIHWWYGKRSHPAEATAGLFAGDPGASLFVYDSIAVTLQNLEADTPKNLKPTFIFTCAEMRDNEQTNANAFCEPENLVAQVLQKVADRKVPIACENALSRYDQGAFQRIQDVAANYKIDYFTYLRLDGVLMTKPSFGIFKTFVNNMEALPITSPQGAPQGASTS